LNIQNFLFITITIDDDYFFSFRKEFNPLDTIGDLKSFLIEIAAERGEFISYSNISVNYDLKTISNDTSIESINLSPNSILNFIDLSNGCGFQIYIQKPDNSKFPIYIHPDFTISDVKRKFSFYQEIPFAQQKLIFNQTILENDKSVYNYSIRNCSTIFLELEKEFNCPILLTLLLVNQDKVFNSLIKKEFNYSDTIKNVKSYICKDLKDKSKIFISLEQLSISFLDSILPDESTLISHNLPLHTFIEAIFTSSDQQYQLSIIMPHNSSFR
jgi:hypothetical protein